MDAIEAEHAAVELFSNHYDQFRNVCLRCCAHVHNRNARAQLADEMLGEVFDRLPNICRVYDPSFGLPLIAWATYSVQFYLRKFKQYTREAYQGADNEHASAESELNRVADSSAELNNEIKGKLATEYACILRQALSTDEWRMLWLRHAEDYTIEQVAHAVNLSVTHTDRKLKRIEKLIRDSFRSEFD